MSNVVIGMDLGGTNAKTAVCSKDGELLGKDSRPTDADQGQDVVLDRMVEGFHAALKDAGLSAGDVLGVGIGVPGPMNWQTDFRPGTDVRNWTYIISLMNQLKPLGHFLTPTARGMSMVFTRGFTETGQAFRGNLARSGYASVM